MWMLLICGPHFEKYTGDSCGGKNSNPGIKTCLHILAMELGGLALLLRLEYSGAILSHCSIDLWGLSHPCTSASQVAGTTGDATTRRHLGSKDQALTRHQTCWCLDLQLPASRVSWFLEEKTQDVFSSCRFQTS
ncbi:uncharacterized protein LOC129036966 [Pongo pygmaeus]|uniref:uncharacterized protein LOC129036966 n=1 Tax=Pongo pygmaeus TaxID=9600 RepID=UPI0023E2C80C|nr:uncharacterized protein LOC129036966 [Pongo pygmaeus]